MTDAQSPDPTPPPRPLQTLAALAPALVPLGAASALLGLWLDRYGPIALGLSLAALGLVLWTTPRPPPALSPPGP